MQTNTKVPVEDELASTENSMRFPADRVQCVRDAEQWRVHGPASVVALLCCVLLVQLRGYGEGFAS